jgi:hypothetical protein
MVSGECGPEQSMPSARAHRWRGDDGGILRTEESVLAGMGIEAADGDAGSAAAHPQKRVVAQSDGLDDARAVELAGLLEGNVRADVDGCQLFRVEQHARLRRAGQLGNVFGVAGKERPESVTASLLSGAVTMASASPLMQSSTARRT